MTEEPFVLPPIRPKRELSAFAKLLRDERKRLGLTQPQAALLLSVDLKTLNNWENDRHPTLKVTQEGALARLFGLPSP